MYVKYETDHHVTPLVEFDGQVSVGLDPFGVGWVHHGLTGGSDSDRLSQLSLP